MGKAIEEQVKTPSETANAESKIDQVIVEAEKPLTRDELMENFMRLKKTHERVLDESRKNKDKWQDLKTEVDTATSQRLEEQGEYKELYTALQSTLSDERKSRMKDRIQHAVSTEATKVGAVDVDDLFVLGNSELLQYDESSGSVHGVDIFIEDLKKRKPHLFGAKPSATVNPSAPGAVSLGKRTLTAGDIAKLPADQKNAVWEAAFKEAAERPRR